MFFSRFGSQIIMFKKNTKLVFSIVYKITEMMTRKLLLNFCPGNKETGIPLNMVLQTTSVSSVYESVPANG